MVSTMSVSGQFVYLKVINWPFAIMFGIIQAISTYVGIKYANRIVRLTGRQSILIFLLAGTLLICLVCLPLKYFIV